MFKPLRRKKNVKIIMWFLVIAFVIWGAGSAITTSRNYAGIIFSKKVSVPEYNRSYQAVLTRLKMAYGDDLPKLEKFLNTKSQVWDRLILIYQAKRQHIRVSNKEVIEKIMTMPFFQRNGIFDKRIYAYIVENMFQVTPHNFEESVREDILIDKLINFVARDIIVAEDEINKDYYAENELCDVSFLLLRSESYKEKITVKDEELLPFYNEHMEDFRSPVMVNVVYLSVPFKDNKADARYIAEEVIASIKNGLSIEKASSKYKIALKETGFFSTTSSIPGVGFSYAFALAAMSLKKGQVSDIVEANDCFYIMKLKDKRPPAILPFEEAKEGVGGALIKQKQEELAKTDAQGIISSLKTGPGTLEDVSKGLSLPLSKAQGISRKSYIEEIGISDSFSETAFSLKVGEIGGPVKTQKGYCIIRLDAVTPVDEKKFQKEKETFAERLKDKKKTEYFQKWFLKIKEKAFLKDNPTLSIY